MCVNLKAGRKIPCNAFALVPTCCACSRGLLAFGRECWAETAMLITSESWFSVSRNRPCNSRTRWLGAPCCAGTLLVGLRCYP